MDEIHFFHGAEGDHYELGTQGWTIRKVTFLTGIINHINIIVLRYTSFRGEIHFVLYGGV